MADVREWAERIADQFCIDGDAIDAIEEGVARGALLASQPDICKAFVALTEEVGAFIYHNNGPKVMPLKRAWNAAFPLAKQAIETQRATTAGRGPQDESAIGEAETPEGGQHDQHS